MALERGLLFDAASEDPLRERPIVVLDPRRVECRFDTGPESHNEREENRRNCVARDPQTDGSSGDSVTGPASSEPAERSNQ